MMVSPMQTRENTQGATAREWWIRLCDPKGGDPGARARLKRCRAALDALTIPAAVSLARRLGATAEAAGPWRLEAALGLARVLAHVDQGGPEPIMRVAGWRTFPGDDRKGEGDPTNRPRLSEARFRRLIQTPPGEELTQMLIRLVHLVGEPINVRALADDFLGWHRDSTRYRWAFQYYAAGVATPDDSNPDVEDRA